MTSVGCGGAERESRINDSNQQPEENMQRKHYVSTAFMAGAALAILVGAASAQVPAGYPADYSKILDGAKKEGKLVVYSPTDAAQAKPIQDAFKAAYPGIAVDWIDLNTNVLYNRVLSEAAAKQMAGDVAWSPAMDTQLNLLERGIAVAYESPEAAKLPAWAKYKNAAYGTTVEPSAIIYNKTLFKEEPPKTRAELIKLLKDKKEALKGKVATFDPEKSGTGFMWATADAKNTSDFFDLAKAFGAVDGKVYSSSGQMREKVLSGEHVLAFNMFSSYAEEWSKKNPTIGVVYTTDYTPAIVRVAVVMKDAPHPNAARLFMDFLLSKAGQEAIGKGGLPSIRDDVPGLNIAEMQKRTSNKLKPIAVDAGLLELLEPAKRAEFLGKWKQSIAN
jgi:iron(III) transport system substrate-binding protein